MFGRCAIRLRQCIHFPRKRGFLSRRGAAGSGPLVARHRQVHAPCEAEIGNGHKRRGAKQAHRCGVLGYKGARRKRLARSSTWLGCSWATLSLSADADKAGEFARIIIEAGEDGVQVGNADVLGQNFTQNRAKIGAQRQIASFESNSSPTPGTNSSLLGSGSKFKLMTHYPFCIYWLTLTR